MKNNVKIWDYIFRPFRFIAGGKALIFGILVMFLLVGLCYLSGTIFNGVFDVHYICEQSTVLEHIYCIFGVYIVTVIIFYITALLASGKNIRIIDIAGTLALAKIPLIITALTGFISVSKALCGIDLDLSPENMQQIMPIILKMLPLLIICIIMSVWYIVLMYNGYSVSANVSDTKGVLTFIAALVVSEVLSAVFLWFIFS